MSIIDVKFVRQTPTGLVDMVKSIRKFMADRVDEVLQNEIDKGNDVYTAEIDNKPINSRQGIYHATKSIRISFQKAAGEIDVERLLRIMRTLVASFYPTDKLDRRIYRVNYAWVSAWLCEKGQAPTPIPAGQKVSLQGNQYIAITVKIPAGQLNPMPVANWLVTRKAQKGMFERASRAMRTAIGVSKRGGSIRVAAVRGRSIHTVQPLSPVEKKKGLNQKTLRAYKPIPRTIAEETNWMIIIELRGNQRGQVLKG